MNPTGHIKIRADGLELKVEVNEVGVYVFEGLKGLILMRSPISGLYTYAWDHHNKQWESLHEVHYMDELLTREFMKHTHGFFAW